MIYTVTFNPAVDCVIRVDQVEFGGINVCQSQEVFYGGKGINVSHVLRELGRESVAWGFLAGGIGRAMDQALREQGLNCDFVFLPEGNTRINTKLVSEGVHAGAGASGDVIVGGAQAAGDADEAALNMQVQDAAAAAWAGMSAAREAAIAHDAACETAFDGAGPVADKVSQLKLFSMLQSTRDDDIIIVAGEVPGNVSDHAYARILESQMGKRVNVVVDAAGDLLLNALPHHPFLIKPNDEELAQIFDFDRFDHDALVECARMLAQLGARNVLVSRGANGSLLLDETGVLHEANALEGSLVSSVGAGDAMVAGFMHGYLEAKENNLPDDEVYPYAYAMAQAAGSATAFSTGLGKRDDILALFNRIQRG